MNKHEIDELQDLIKWIESQPRFKPKADLKRIKQALKMKHIDLEDSYMVHVAGTNGKGSTCQFLTQIFLAKGLTVGTFSSPYILNFSERITINNEPLSDKELIDVLKDVKLFNDQFEGAYTERLSFFELLTLASLMVFQQKHLNVVIMEVGIGGLLDATNAYKHYDLSLITNIGFDHMTQLGNTLESIAYNKLGILRVHGRLLTTVDDSLIAYFRAFANKLSVNVSFIDKKVDIISENPLVFNYKGDRYQSGLSGNYQINNAILAISAALESPFNISKKTIQNGLKLSYIPGRFTEIKPQVIVDGAHNTHAIEALKKTIINAYPNYKVHILFSALGDKDIEKMMVQLESFAYQLDLVSFPDSRYLSLESFKKNNRKYIDEDVIDYLNKLIKHKKEDELILITGSLHFVGYILNFYK